MPIWKKEELKALQKYIKIEGHELSDDQFETRYTNFGGRIRFIFSLEIDDLGYLDKLKISVSNLGFSKLINALSPINIDITQSEKGEGPSMIFVYDVYAKPIKVHEIEFKYLLMHRNYAIAIASDLTRYLIALKAIGKTS